jgi:hypothetical protein
MLKYFMTGKYIADTTVQAELFGPVPTIEDSLRRDDVGRALWGGAMEPGKAGLRASLG